MMDKFINDNLDNFRYERKFVVEVFRFEEIINYIKLHPANFSEIFYERQINNIYFDTFDKVFLHDNLIGASERLKVRIRWYGETFGLIASPTLEFKIKKEELNVKESFTLEKLFIERKVSNEGLLKCFRKSELPPHILNTLKYLEVTLLNSYSRRYFQSFDKNFRVTIDHNLSYYQINSNNDSSSFIYNDSPHFIVELKYNMESDDRARDISNNFPFRISKNSKYVDGLLQLSKHI